MIKPHSFHIPVMGIAYTIDTPYKVSQYGIDSVLSIGDDILIEKLRKWYCEQYELAYNEISNKIEDYRALRISSYLNLMNELADKKFEELKKMMAEAGSEVKEYFNLLPDGSKLLTDFKEYMAKCPNLNEIGDWMKENISMGSIDVNIMTKLDKENFFKKEKLGREYNDAHAALRGFANSNLKSSVILSAGLNPRLYGYFEQFEDFYHNINGEVKKKIVIKVSDYRSALIQGKFFAKKGLWVTEYRIESGLNCGGHAFATQGYLLGPILDEFRKNRSELIKSVREVLDKALEAKGRAIPEAELELLVTAQGGVGTSEEHNFLLEHYKVDSVGWGTPFLLVPEAVNVEEETLNLLIDAKEKDLHLSNISPLGVPFNSLKSNTQDRIRNAKIESDRPGSSCPKRFLALDNREHERGLCTASRQFQKAKIKELESEDLPMDQFMAQVNKITEKTCLCVGLGNAVMKKNEMERKIEGDGVSICPGPNMAYFSKIMSLKDITDHIYGRVNMMDNPERPNMFIKELNIYLEFFKGKIEEIAEPINRKQEKYLSGFSDNLKEGISYYYNLFGNLKNRFIDNREGILKELEISKSNLAHLDGMRQDLSEPDQTNKQKILIGSNQ